MAFLEKLREKWNMDRGIRLAAALLLNGLFLLLMLSCFTPRFETNDEVLMSKFVDGQMAEKSAYIPFINIVLGFFLKLEYSLLGESLNWYSISQYAMMFCGFAAVSWVLLRRFRPLPALSMAAIVLMTVGMNAYLYPSFSKVCALGTAGGLTLMLYAKGGERLEKLPLALGFVLALLGYLWRYEEFFGVAAVGFSVNYLDNPAGLELCGLYELEDEEEKMRLLRENFDRRRRDFLLTGYQIQEDDPADCAREGPLVQIIVMKPKTERSVHGKNERVEHKTIHAQGHHDEGE